MNMPKLIVGSAVVATTLMVSGASAFAAAPAHTPQVAPGAVAIMSHTKATEAHDRFAKLQASVAQALGLTTDQLKTELQTKTLDQLAAEHGTTRSQLMAQALKNAGFSDSQIQKVMNAIAKAAHNQSR